MVGMEVHREDNTPCHRDPRRKGMSTVVKEVEAGTVMITETVDVEDMVVEVAEGTVTDMGDRTVSREDAEAYNVCAYNKAVHADIQQATGRRINPY